ncbi:Protein of unknown function [Paenibacillus barengoltzii]|uniref:DUF3939 domain-containing protein n=1 Tax=Paenibacillus barengoltzii TaxID=343517 RepID=UPI000A08BBC2|nr:DUF3939 domain-containing protein [Paenibacillus barengoltzii]SMF09337.1 Protein of unknown function [Paenibacillus barengoltzii]
MTKYLFLKQTCWRSTALIVILVLTTSLLSGCLYRGERQQGGPVSYIESVDRVQRAIDRFQEDKAILPIITAGEDTPRYEKYKIDLNQLKREGYLEELPAAAFEQGGSVYFLVIDEETDPTVKVMDLNTVQKVNDVQHKVLSYRTSHSNALPGEAEGEVYPGLYTVNLSLLKADSLALTSVYSGETLSYLMDKQGNVYVNYAFDIMQAIDQSGKTPQGDEDLRTWLTDRSAFVPVKSLPYRWNGSEPVPYLN